MKLGIMMALFGGVSLDEALDRAASMKLDAVEVGVGNYPGGSHCPMLKELAANKAKAKDWARKAADRGLVISALACHGNPLHPDPAFARKHHEVWRNAVKLASHIGVDTITGFSGCPGGSDRDKTPNWVVCSWPPDFSRVLDWQWSKRIIPYWKKEAKFAADHGVRVAFEMHQGMSVYNTETLLRIRGECGGNLGANLDPSHLFWQGMDPLAVTRKLGGRIIYHTHAKDTRIDPANAALNGTLDTKSYGDVLQRSWVFRTVGYGHGADWWRDFISNLRMVGYDGVLSIEHEDGLMSVGEGFTKGVEFLRALLIKEQPGAMWWA
jgi:sugar phosphate isomerase/epimerase